jgi:ATP-dependent Lon protease
VYENLDIHIHIPEGAIPKDGPSAGITICTALISAYTGREVRKDVGMTGEITLRGHVLPVGGIREKVLSAHRSGLKTVILPKRNAKDLVDVPKRARSEMQLVFVEHIDQVLEVALKPRKPTENHQRRVPKKSKANNKEITEEAISAS